MEREKKKQRRVCDSPEKQKTRRIKVIRGLATDWKSIYLKQRSTYITHHSTHTHTHKHSRNTFTAFFWSDVAQYIFFYVYCRRHNTKLPSHLLLRCTTNSVRHQAGQRRCAAGQQWFLPRAGFGTTIVERATTIKVKQLKATTKNTYTHSHTLTR